MKKKTKIIIIIGIVLLIACVTKGVLYTIEYDEDLQRPKTIYQDIKLEDIENITLNHLSFPKLGEYQLSTEEMEKFVSLLQKVGVYALYPNEVIGAISQVTINKVDGDSLYLEFRDNRYIIDKGAVYECDSCEINQYLTDIARIAWKQKVYRDIKLEDIRRIVIYYEGIPELGEYQLSVEEMEKFVSLLQKIDVYAVSPRRAEGLGLKCQVTIIKFVGLDSLYLGFSGNSYIEDRGIVFECDSDEINQYLVDMVKRVWIQKASNESLK